MWRICLVVVPTAESPFWACCISSQPSLFQKTAPWLRHRLHQQWSFLQDISSPTSRAFHLRRWMLRLVFTRCGNHTADTCVDSFIKLQISANDCQGWPFYDPYMQHEYIYLHIYIYIVYTHTYLHTYIYIYNNNISPFITSYDMIWYSMILNHILRYHIWYVVI